MGFIGLLSLMSVYRFRTFQANFICIITRNHGRLENRETTSKEKNILLI